MSNHRTTPVNMNRPLRRATYADMRLMLINLLEDINILAGNALPAQGASMHDVIGTAHTNASHLARQLEACYQGITEGFMVYPDPEECLHVALGDVTEE